MIYLLPEEDMQLDSREAIKKGNKVLLHLRRLKKKLKSLQ